MNNGNASDDISLKLLNELQREPMITQRALAANLGIALGLVNAYVRRLYKKGYIKVKNLPKKRIKYIITPKGFIEKVRLTYSYMHTSINHFKHVRYKIEQTYSLMIALDIKRMLLWGDGEIAELCYISARGLPLEIMGIIGEKKVENGFFNNHVYTVKDIDSLDFDAILVSSMADEIIKAVNQCGINNEKIYYL